MLAISSKIGVWSIDISAGRYINRSRVRIGVHGEVHQRYIGVHVGAPQRYRGLALVLTCGRGGPRWGAPAGRGPGRWPCARWRRRRASGPWCSGRDASRRCGAAPPGDPASGCLEAVGDGGTGGTTTGDPHPVSVCLEGPERYSEAIWGNNRIAIIWTNIGI